MDRMHEIEVFIAVAEAGSFARAGKRLRLSPPAITRAVAALEGRLGARVFNRTTRSLAITDVGRLFLERARHILMDLDAVEKEVMGETANPQGHLTITASVTLGRTVVAPVARTFLDAHPRTTMTLLMLDRVASLIDEGMDAAVRIGPLPDSTLMAKRIGTVRRVLVASPSYLARRGTPTSPTDLRQHTLIGFTGLGSGREWRFGDGAKGKRVSIEPRFEINDAVTAIAAAEAGEGITMALSYMVAEKVRKTRLVCVLDDMMPAPVPVHLVHAQGRQVAAKLQAFLSFAGPRLTRALERLSMRKTDRGH